MKVQKHKAYSYKGKDHYKYVIVVPEKTISELDWKDGTELQSSVENSSLRLSASKKGSTGQVAVRHKKDSKA